jgi:DNA-binding CsgD family transcriptional regulator
VSTDRCTEDRHVSLEASVEWSYSLLGADERRALRAVSVLPGPFDLGAAGAALGVDAPDLLAALVRRSMLVPPSPGTDGRLRYAILETVRAYAAVRLEEAGETVAARASVVGWAVGAAKQHAQGFESTATEEGAARWFDAEQDNLLGCVEWALEHHLDGAVELVIALCPWWQLRGRALEARTTLERAAALVPESEPALTVWIGSLSRRLSDFEAAERHLCAAIARLRFAGPSRLLVDSLIGLAAALVNTGREAEAAAADEEALSMSQLIDYRSGAALACVGLMVEAFYRDDRQLAFEWAVAANEHDSVEVSGFAERSRLEALGSMLMFVGRPEEAHETHSRALELNLAIGDSLQTMVCLLRLGMVENVQERWEEGRGHFLAALQLGRERGGSPYMVASVLLESSRNLLHSDAAVAAVALGASEALLERLTNRPVRSQVADYQAGLRSQIASRVDEEVVCRALKRGRDMSTKEAIAFTCDRLAEQASGPAPPPLSGRERELLALLAAGLTDAEIGEKLFISIRTVRSHLDRIRDKTGRRKRVELARLAVESGLQPAPAAG